MGPTKYAGACSKPNNHALGSLEADVRYHDIAWACSTNNTNQMNYMCLSSAIYMCYITAPREGEALGWQYPGQCGTYAQRAIHCVAPLSRSP